MRKLTPQRALMGSCNTGQGRVQAVVTLLEREEGLVALFPTPTVERQLGRMRASIISSKVSLERVPWAVAPIAQAEAAQIVSELPRAPGDSITEGQLTLLRWWGPQERYLLIAPRTSIDAHDRDSTFQDLRWRAADVIAGLPQVYPDTQSSFVPQMLNLDLLGGISYDKGCYIGQEVVARARRAGVPRRMFRFTAACPAPSPGTLIMNGAVEVGEVVDAVATASGCDLLAVVSLDRVSSELSLGASPLVRAPLPYEVPLNRSDARGVA